MTKAFRQFGCWCLTGMFMLQSVSNGQVPIGAPIMPSSSGVMQAGGPTIGNDPIVRQSGSFDQFGADAKMGRKAPVKPSQKAAPNSAENMVNAPRFTPTAETSQGRYLPPASANGPQTNPNQITPEPVPLIPRRNGAPAPFQSSAPATTSNEPSARPMNGLSSPINVPISNNATQSNNGSVNIELPMPSGTAAVAPRTLQERLAAARRGPAQSLPPTVQSAEQNAASTGMTIESGTTKEPTLAKPEYQAATSGMNNLVQPGARKPLGQTITNPLTDQGDDQPSARTASVPSSRRVFDDSGELPSILNTAPATNSGSQTNSGPTLTPSTAAPGTSSRKPFTVTTPSARIADQGGERPATTTNGSAAAVSNAATGPLLSTRQTPQISVETVGPRTITVGKEATYEVQIKNLGEQAAQDVTVTVRVPDFAELQGTKPSNGTADTITNTANPEASSYTLQWTLPRLEPAGKETLGVRLIPRKSRPFELGVQWSISPVSSQAMVEVQEPQLTVSLTGPSEILYGQTKIFKLNLANPGTGDAENVTIHLSPLSDPNAPMTKHQIGNLAAGDSKIIEVEMTARQAGKVVIRAMATADNGLQADIQEEVNVRRAGLQVATTSPKSKYTGTSAIVSVQVSNPGDAPAEKVQLTANIPSGAKFLSSSSGKFNPDSNTVTWNIASLAAGSEQMHDFKCLVLSPGTNKIAVQAQAVGDLTASNSTSIQVEALADLKLEVSEPKGPLPLGEEVTYEIQIKNRGSKSAEKIHVVAFFEEGIDPVSAVGGQHELGTGDVRFAPIASLAPGASVSFKIKALPKKYGNLAFRAEAVCEVDGSKLAQQCTVLYYGDEPAATGAKPVAGPDDDISAANGQPTRSVTGSSRKPLVQPAPTTAPALPTGGIPINNTVPMNPVPLNGPAVTAPAAGIPLGGPTAGPAPAIATPVNAAPAAQPLPTTTPNVPMSLPALSMPTNVPKTSATPTASTTPSPLNLPAVPNTSITPSGPTLLLPNK